MPLRIRSLPVGRTLIFDGVERFSLHPTDSARFEFVGSFFEQEGSGRVDQSTLRRRELSVPLSFLSMFHDSSVWRDQLPFGSRDFYRSQGLRAATFSVAALSDRLVHRFGAEDAQARSSYIVRADEVGKLAPQAKLGLLGRTAIGATSLGWSEFLRFYLCGFGMILHDILACAQAAGDLSLLCHAGEVRLEDGVLSFRPLAHLQDRASILQVAILLADSALRAEVLRLARLVAIDASGMQSEAFVPRFPEGTEDLKVQYRSDRETLRGASEASSYRKIVRIRADPRPAMFDKVIADVKLSERGERKEEEEDGDEEQYREATRSSADEELNAASRGDRGGTQISTPLTWQNFRESFPAYRRVRVELVEPAARVIVPILLPLRYLDVRENEVTAGGRSTTAGQPVLRNGRGKRRDPELPDRELLVGLDLFEVPLTVSVRTTSLSRPLDALMQAAEILSFADYRPTPASDFVTLYEAPPSWGGFSRLASGRQRRFLAFPIVAGDATAHVVDFERDTRGLRTSIGIVARADGQRMTDLELWACVRSAVRHVSNRDRHAAKNVRNQTIWPSSSFYTDVTSRSVRHLARYRDPDVLALALASAAALLFG
jgi:hypothetical protein